MARAAWRLTAMMVALVWWLSGATYGAKVHDSNLQHRNSLSSHHAPQEHADKKPFTGIQSNPPLVTEQPNRPRRSPSAMTKAMEHLRAAGASLTPYQLRQLLRARGNRFSHQSYDEPTTHQKELLDSQSSSLSNAPNKRQDKLRDAPQNDGHKRWLDLFGGSSVESRFPLPERRQFPEVDWRGFNEDVFHESFGDFSPMKRWKRESKRVI